MRESSIHGYGLFATRNFSRGDVIIPYTGESFSSVDAMLTSLPGNDRAPSWPESQGRTMTPYAMRVHGDSIVDATRVRSYAACINGSTRGKFRSCLCIHRYANVRTSSDTPGPFTGRLMRCSSPPQRALTTYATSYPQKNSTASTGSTHKRSKGGVGFPVPSYNHRS